MFRNRITASGGRCTSVCGFVYAAIQEARQEDTCRSRGNWPPIYYHCYCSVDPSAVMATSAGSKDDHQNRPQAATNNMEVEFNLSWFTKRDKPLISIKTKKDDTSSESSSSGEAY